MSGHPVLVLPNETRHDFKDPRAAPHVDLPNWIIESAEGLVCVGDVVSIQCLRASPDRAIVVFDGVTRREEEVPDVLSEATRLGYDVIEAWNPPGTISLGVVELLCRAMERGERLAIMVRGEEDMLSLAAASCIPSGWLLVYGLPGVGVSVVSGTLKARRDASLRILGLRPGIVDNQAFKDHSGTIP